MGAGGNEKASQRSVLEPQTKARKGASWVYREEGEKQEAAPAGSQRLCNDRV